MCVIRYSNGFNRGTNSSCCTSCSKKTWLWSLYVYVYIHIYYFCIEETWEHVSVLWQQGKYQLDQASTWARTRPGQDADGKIYKSAWFGNLSAYSWKIPFTVFIAPERIRALRCLRERANFPRRDFAPEQSLDAEMNFGTPSADCLHCPADIVRTSRLFSVLPHLPQTILDASALRTASRMFGEPSGKHADSAEDIRC